MGSLKAVKPDVMLFASYASDAILMLKTLKAQKAQPKIIWGQDAGFEAPEFRTTLGDDVIGDPDPNRFFCPRWPRSRR